MSSTITQDGVRNVGSLKSYDNNWDKFIVRFEVYLKAKQKHTAAEDIRIAILLNVVGEDAFCVYENFTAEQIDTYDHLKKAFKDYYAPLRSVTLLRHKFNTRNQHEGESIEDYVTELRQLAKDCEFGDLLDGLIKDRIVCGLIDNTARELLLREKKLTLEKSLEIVRASEQATQEMNKLMQKSVYVDTVSNRSQRSNFVPFKSAPSPKEERTCANSVVGVTDLERKIVQHGAKHVRDAKRETILLCVVQSLRKCQR